MPTYVTLTLTLVGILLSTLYLKRILMATKEELSTEIDNLAAEVEKANGKADAVITLLGTVKQELADLQAGGGASAADLDAMLAKIKVAEASLVVQEGEDDAAVA